MTFAEIQDPRFFDWLMAQSDRKQDAVRTYLDASLRYESTLGRAAPSDTVCKLLTQRDQAWSELRFIHNITILANGQVRVS